MDLGVPLIIALNMIDVAKAKGNMIDAAQLEAQLGVPVIPIQAKAGEGLSKLGEAIENAAVSPKKYFRSNQDEIDTSADYITFVENLVSLSPLSNGKSVAPEDKIEFKERELKDIYHRYALIKTIARHIYSNKKRHQRIFREVGCFGITSSRGY